MIRTLWLLALVACLWAPVIAQDRPQKERAPAAADKRSPATGQNIRLRFQQYRDFAMSSGHPERFLPKPAAMRIEELLAQRRLEEAATQFNEVVRAMESRSREEPPAPEERPFGEKPLVGPGHDTPMMLSAPSRALPISSAEMPAPAVAREPSQIQEDAIPRSEAPHPRRLLKIAAGLLLLAAIMIPVALWKSRRTESPTETKRALTDKYSVGPLITSGGMGEVYEGRDLTLGRRVALKKMLPDLKLDASLRQQFLHEARTVAKLTHPYIVQIHDCLESGEDVYLVFEFVKGRTLAQLLIERPRLPLKECLKIFSHVCPAIDHAHKNHILHRDLKPANIMIDDNGISRVMDFGIALESTRTVTSVGPGHLDASGTLRYMPPEQHYGKSVRASDVYAMGVCLYEMATGTLPFAADSVEELIEQKRSRRFPAPSALVPSLPKEFDLFVTAVLAPDPQDRMGSAQEFLELLEGVAAA